MVEKPDARVLIVLLKGNCRVGQKKQKLAIRDSLLWVRTGQRVGVRERDIELPTAPTCEAVCRIHSSFMRFSKDDAYHSLLRVLCHPVIMINHRKQHQRVDNNTVGLCWRHFPF